MTVLGIILTRSEAMYPVTLIVRTFFLAGFAAFYFQTRDPLFLVLLAIVGLGFVITLTSYLSDRKATR
jgi:energy-converting hydrogenase Eha subunit G